MTELEIAHQSAQLALDNERIEILSDLVKIGIPSAVALAGLVSTFLLTRLGHVKDLKIEKLRNSHSTQKVVEQRKGNLIEEISIESSRLHKIALRYANNLFAKLDMEKDGLSFPERNRRELSDQYQKLVDEMHESFSMEAKTFLLGDKSIDEKFNSYQSSVSYLSMTFDPSIPVDLQTRLTEHLISMRGSREEFLSSLSKVYLISRSK